MAQWHQRCARDSGAWNEIFDNYKTTIQAQLPGVTFTKDDVEEIALVPAKISKNNGTNPDMHLDCNVSIKCKNVALVKYYLRDAGSTQFEQKGARNYISGNATQPSDVMNEQFPETKDGRWCNLRILWLVFRPEFHSACNVPVYG